MADGRFHFGQEHDTAVPMDKETNLNTLPDSEAFRILADSPISMVLTDPTLPDNPIVYVNRAFERVTGYGPSSAIGRNCRFLQGEKTDEDDLQRIRDALKAETETTIDIVNYRADGVQFLNRLLLSPVYDTEGNLTHFLGIQKALSDAEASNSANVTQKALRELKHRVKNHLAMIVSLIRLQGRSSPDPAPTQSLARRVESLLLLYEELSEPTVSHRTGNVSLGSYLSRLVSTTAHLDGRAGIRVNSQIEDATCGSEVAAKIGLLLSEIMTNALQHAFEGRAEGVLNVSMIPLGATAIEVTIADNGIGFAEGVEWPKTKSVGGRVVLGLMMELGAERDVTSGDKGTTIRLKIPIETQ
ncbi:PAS domain-containing protein [Psychromarinibacter halotolerans]